jgi:hypothetical protein
MDMNSANSIEPAPVVSASLNIASNFSGFKVGKPGLKLAQTIMGRVVLRTVWEENIEWNLFSVQFLIRPFLETCNLK